jgi:AcrR family transcriptional regulator
MNEKEKPTDIQLLNKRKFFTAAESLINRFGYRKTTIQDICKAAGMSKPTFYSLFTDKADLFVKMMLYISETAILKWENELPDEINPMQKLLRFFDFYTDLYTSKPIFRSFYFDPAIMEKFAGFFYSKPDSPLLTLLKNILNEGMKSGHFRKIDPEPIIWMIYTSLDMMYILIPMMTDKPGPGEKPELAEEIRQFILHGVGANNE